MDKELQYKIRRKLASILGKTIPYNGHYRPKGIYHTSKEFIKTVKGKQPLSAYAEIYPGLTSSLNIDTGFYQACIEDGVRIKGNTVTTDYVVTAIEEGRVYVDEYYNIAIISKDNHLVGDVSFSYKHRKVAPAEDNAVFAQKYFHHPQHYKGVVFSMLAGEGAVTNYGHWLIDTLPRIHLLKKSGWFDKVDWFLVPNKYDFHLDSLKLLGIPVEKIIRANGPLHIKADVLIASTAPRGNDYIHPMWMIDFLKEAYLPQEGTYKPYPPLVYISRKDSKLRSVTNDDEVISFLGRYGFKSYVLSELPFIEKVKLFASADVVISTTGAAMDNTVFCKQGTKVVEIFSNGNAHAETYSIATRAGLDYYYILKSSKKRANNAEQGLLQDVTIDLNKLRDILDKVFSNTRQTNTTT